MTEKTKGTKDVEHTLPYEPSSVEKSADKVKLTMSLTEYLRKYILISVIGVVLLVMQSTMFGRQELFAVTPDLIFMYAVAIAFFDGEKPGMIAGIAAGFFSDMLGADGATPQCLVFMCCTVATALTVRGRLHKNLPSWLFCSAGACLVKAVYEIMYISLISSSYNVVSLLGGLIFPELGLCVLFGIPLFYLMRKINKSF